VTQGYQKPLIGRAAYQLVRNKLLLLLGLGIVKAAADQTLGRVDRVGRVGDGLALSRLANETLTKKRKRESTMSPCAISDD
jgi:hypothetical protein